MTDNLVGRTGLYTVLGVDEEVIYVGIGFNPLLRLKFHSKREWWKDVREIRIDWFETRVEAEAAEVSMIKALNPRANVVHANHPETDQPAPPRPQPSDPKEPWLRAKRAMEILGVGPSELYRHVRNGSIRYRVIPYSRHRRYSPDDVRALLIEYEDFRRATAPRPLAVVDGEVVQAA